MQNYTTNIRFSQCLPKDIYYFKIRNFIYLFSVQQKHSLAVKDSYRFKQSTFLEHLFSRV